MCTLRRRSRAWRYPKVSAAVESSADGGAHRLQAANSPGQGAAAGVLRRGCRYRNMPAHSRCRTPPGLRLRFAGQPMLRDTWCRAGRGDSTRVNLRRQPVEWVRVGDQAQLTSPRNGLGAVGRAELAQNVADMLLDGVEGDHELASDRLIRRPATSISRTSSSRVVSGSMRPGRPGSFAGCPGGRPAGAGPDNRAGPRRLPGRCRTAITRPSSDGHRRALIGEDPHVALRAGEHRAHTRAATAPASSPAAAAPAPAARRSR